MPFRLLNDTGARHLPAASMMVLAFNVARADVMATHGGSSMTMPRITLSIFTIKRRTYPPNLPNRARQG